MKREGLIEKAQVLAEENGVKISKKNLGVVTKAILDAMVEGFEEDREVELVGYFSIKEVNRAEKSVPVEIGSKEKKTIPARKDVKFKAGKAFKDAV